MASMVDVEHGAHRSIPIPAHPDQMGPGEGPFGAMFAGSNYFVAVSDFVFSSPNAIHIHARFSAIWWSTCNVTLGVGPAVRAAC